MPLQEGTLAVVKRSGLYKDLDSGDKDALYARDVVRTVHRRGASWVVDPGPFANTMLVPAAALVAFKDPALAEQRYKPGGQYGRRNPRRRAK